MAAKVISIGVLALRIVPARYAWASFDSPLLTQRVHPRKAIAAGRVAAETVAETEENSVVGTSQSVVTLYGPTGAGKTVLATSILRACIEQHGYPVDSCLFATSFALARARRDSKLGREPELLTQAREAQLLLLDDLGLEDAAFSGVLVELLHERHATNETTIVTTWLDPDGVRERYGDAIARRLFGSIVLELGGR